MIHIARPPPSAEVQLLLSKAPLAGPPPQQLRDALVEVFHGKCAYCETPVGKTASVDRFRPRRWHPEGQWDWSNLYLCCPACNAHKADTDPNDPKTGRSWLIDPCAEDPEELLAFLPFGSVAPRLGVGNEPQERAERTIKALGLNRDTLVSKRGQVVEAMRDLLASHGGPDLVPKDLLGARTGDEAPYAATARSVLRPGLAAPMSRKPTRHLLRRLTLNNIGAFTSLELDLQPGWNLLLGANGCGKTTVLKAIAFALAGSDARAAPAASPLLRAEQESGHISYEIDDETESWRAFLVRLDRVKDQVRCADDGESPVRDGDWLALAFPAVRGLPSRVLQGPTTTPSARPGAHDLLPILFDEPDPRIDDTRQWVVNTAVRLRISNGREGLSRLKRMFDHWFEILQKGMPGLAFTFEDVDMESWRVLVRTTDGVVPLERVSQGMISTIAWLGTLQRRLAEAFPESEEPEKEEALVLIEELRTERDQARHYAKLRLQEALYSTNKVQSIRNLMDECQAGQVKYSGAVMAFLRDELAKHLAALRCELADGEVLAGR